VTDQCHQIYLK